MMSLLKSTKVCCFCSREDTDPALYGGLKSTKTINAHYFCLLLSTNIKQSGLDKAGILGFLRSDIRNELQRSKDVLCCYCKSPNATVHCSATRCKKVFHLPCGMEKNSSHSFFGTFKSYCHQHRQVQKIRTPLKRSMTELSCIICAVQFVDGDQEKVFWPECCKAELLLHRICVQRYAISAGYYTKCPTCNNDTTFIQTCRMYGIFVPEQDASWENEPGAFSDLYENVVSMCAAEKCICHRGKSYSEDFTEWEILSCCSCGSVGAHRACINKDDFCCNDCKKICDKFGFSEIPYSSDSDSYEGTGNKLNEIETPAPLNPIEGRQDSLSPIPSTSRNLNSDEITDLPHTVSKPTNHQVLSLTLPESIPIPDSPKFSVNFPEYDMPGTSSFVPFTEDDYAVSSKSGTYSCPKLSYPYSDASDAHMQSLLKSKRKPETITRMPTGEDDNNLSLQSANSPSSRFFVESSSVEYNEINPCKRKKRETNVTDTELEEAAAKPITEVRTQGDGASSTFVMEYDGLQVTRELSSTHSIFSMDTEVFNPDGINKEEEIISLSSDSTTIFDGLRYLSAQELEEFNALMVQADNLPDSECTEFFEDPNIQ